MSPRKFTQRGRKRRRGKRCLGFTITEMVVAMTVAGMMMGTFASAYQAMLRIHRKSNLEFELQQQTMNLVEQIHAKPVDSDLGKFIAELTANNQQGRYSIEIESGESRLHPRLVRLDIAVADPRNELKFAITTWLSQPASKDADE